MPDLDGNMEGQADLQLEERFTLMQTLEENDGVIERVQKKESSERSSVESEKTYQKILQKTQTVQPAQTQTITSEAQSLSNQSDRDAQVQQLIELALTKGIVHAVKVARHAQNYYILDRFHDQLLADDLHDALVRKGLIEPF